MANLSKTKNGLIFTDSFGESTLMWTQSPSDIQCLQFTEDGMRMKHNSKYCMYTAMEPSAEEYSCIASIDHIPFDTGDIAGVLVMANTQEYAECQSYMSAKPSGITNVDAGESFADVYYKYIKINKVKHSYVFYASPDGYSWIEIGSATFGSACSVGFFIYGTDNEALLETDVTMVDNGDTLYRKVREHSYFYVHGISFFAGKYLTIAEISREYEFEIADGNGHLLFRTDSEIYSNIYNRSNHECVINTTSMPMPIENASVRVYKKDSYNETVATYSLGEKAYGGDVFTLARDIRVYINNEYLGQDKVHDLGTFYRGSYYVRMEVHNNEEYEVTNVRLKVSRYSEYYGGEEQVDVALYDGTSPEDMLQYGKEITIPSIKPSEGMTVFMRLSDRQSQNLFQAAGKSRFKITIE